MFHYYKYVQTPICYPKGCLQNQKSQFPENGGGGGAIPPPTPTLFLMLKEIYNTLFLLFFIMIKLYFVKAEKPLRLKKKSVLLNLYEQLMRESLSQGFVDKKINPKTTE